MLKRNLVLGGALLALTPTFAMASRKYGMAGCGLGSIVMGPNGSQLSAATTNNSIGGTQLFGITSGTSNCTPDKGGRASIEQEMFMMDNYAVLSKEMAQGSGTTLAGLAQLLGCGQNDVSAFNAHAQQEHRKIFSAPGAVAALETLKSTLQENTTLAQNCKFAALNNAEESAQ